MAWKSVGSCPGDSYMIDGIDIFNEDWVNTGETTDVVDPLYGQRFKFTVYRIKKPDRIINFATGEWNK